MFKKRNVRPPPTRQKLSEEEETDDIGEKGDNADADDKVNLEELIQLRKLKRSRQGIEADKLNKGEIKKKKKKVEGDSENDVYGLQKPKGETSRVEDDDDGSDEESKTRKLVRSNNFTQQTNALDVDKHMMAYIEEGLKKRRGEAVADDEAKPDAPYDPYEELFRIEDKYKVTQKKEDEEGNVTNSMAMLTAIPEVDLGMDVRLRNIEETEKAKRAAADERHSRPSRNKNDEAHLAAARFYQPHHNRDSEVDALRNAQLEAMGLPREREPRKAGHENRKDMATDDLVMERFKKRMRR